jgi:tetratricopeptide (TPR) repeat protein
MSADADPKDIFCRLLNAWHAANERGDVQAAQSLAFQLLSIASIEQARNPSEDLRLRREACEHADAARWEQAEAAYRRALALSHNESNHPMIYKAHSDLSHLYEIRGMPDRALQEARAAAEAARKSEIAVLLSTALRDLTLCHLKEGDIVSAADTAEQAVQTAGMDKVNQIQRARALLMRARCRVEERRISEAHRDLDDAWQILVPLAGTSIFAGVQGSLASWWEITARIRSDSNDAAGAAEALGNAVAQRRAVSEMPHVCGPHKFFLLANTLREYSVALSAAGTMDAAIEAFDESRTICLKIGTGVPASSTVSPHDGQP